ncbi:hypothetical protein B0H13DRAFT_2331833 [Mycena leptocephala]|nr:hypothetical protein B0H13DRAFT_2331833 [Mycena leptocephala]
MSSIFSNSSEVHINGGTFYSSGEDLNIYNRHWQQPGRASAIVPSNTNRSYRHEDDPEGGSLSSPVWNSRTGAESGRFSPYDTGYHSDPYAMSTIPSHYPMARNDPFIEDSSRSGGLPFDPYMGSNPSFRDTPEQDTSVNLHTHWQNPYLSQYPQPSTMIHGDHPSSSRSSLGRRPPSPAYGQPYSFSRRSSSHGYQPQHTEMERPNREAARARIPPRAIRLPPGAPTARGAGRTQQLPMDFRFLRVPTHTILWPKMIPSLRILPAQADFPLTLISLRSDPM